MLECASSRELRISTSGWVLTLERWVAAQLLQIERADVGIGKVGILHIGALKRRSGQHSVSEDGALQTATLEASPVNDTVGEVRPVEVAVMQISLAELTLHKLDLGNIGIGHDDTGEIISRGILSRELALTQIIKLRQS